MTVVDAIKTFFEWLKTPISLGEWYSASVVFHTVDISLYE
jgi:hypothetical protein